MDLVEPTHPRRLGVKREGISRAIIAMLVFPLGTLWFGFHAIRGGSMPTEGSERARARKR